MSTEKMENKIIAEMIYFECTIIGTDELARLLDGELKSSELEYETERGHTISVPDPGLYGDRIYIYVEPEYVALAIENGAMFYDFSAEQVLTMTVQELAAAIQSTIDEYSRKE